jgi:SAM-dependent methyltransferase
VRPVVDLGFGRGEFLDLLRERGIECSGVEVDDALVREVRQRGHDVETGDAVAWLASAVDGSLGGISLIQVIEHLTPRRREEVVALAARKLRRGGRLVVETLNPQSLYIFARAFYADPTHVTPVHPAYLLFLVEHAGFSGVTIEWRSDPPRDEVLEAAGGSSDIDRVHDENVRRLNSLLFAPQDYAIIATR